MAVTSTYFFIRRPSDNRRVGCVAIERQGDEFVFAASLCQPNDEWKKAKAVNKAQGKLRAKNRIKTLNTRFPVRERNDWDSPLLPSLMMASGHSPDALFRAGLVGMNEPDDSRASADEVFSFWSADEAEDMLHRQLDFLAKFEAV
jgi:hypothetical protein